MVVAQISESNLWRDDGIRVESVPRIHDVGHPSKNMTELQCETEQFKDRTIFMSVYKDIIWGERGNTEECEKKFSYGCELSQIPAQTKVIFGIWGREENLL